MPRVVGTHDDLFKRSTEWNVIVEHTELMVCFGGGVNLKNTGINHGGGPPGTGPRRSAPVPGQRREDHLDQPLRSDVDGECDWLPAVPGTDVAIMLALAYVLATANLADREFLDTYCTGYEQFERYLLGTEDGVPKSPQWAAEICGIDAAILTELATTMASRRTIVTVSWSLQRVRHGEQAPWMGLTLAAMLGQIGSPRRRIRPRVRLDERTRPAAAAIPAADAAAGGVNPVRTFILSRPSAICCCTPPVRRSPTTAAP